MTLVALFTFICGAALAIAAAVVDARTHRLPNKYTLPLAVIGACGLAVASIVGDEPIRIMRMVAGVVVFCGPWLLAHVVAPAGIGFGDIKFAFGLGIYLGWLAPVVALIGFFASPVAFGVIYLIGTSEPNRAIPFGPALLSGAAVAVVGHGFML